MRPKPTRLPHLLGIFALSLPSFGQYRPNELPREWTFSSPTPAYSLEAPHEEIGKFQPGIRVDVNDSDVDGRLWQVAFRRIGSADIQAQIHAPDLSDYYADHFATIEPIIARFPILQTLLEADEPWPATAKEMAQLLGWTPESVQVVSGSQQQPLKLLLKSEVPSYHLWGIAPLSILVDYISPQQPQITIELWNKGDAFQSSLNPSRTHRDLRDSLERIQQVLRSKMDDPAHNSGSAAILAARIKESVYTLPNDLRVALRYDNNEYLTLNITSIRNHLQKAAVAYDPATFRASIRKNVVFSEEGHQYIQNIPMIDQGDKGYCAAASLARVLQYYGFAVDLHAIAELAETEAQYSKYDRGGTQREDMLQAIRRVANTTPFRMQEIRKAHPEAIREAIEQGIPILWFIPGHARLLIGLHPETNEIVFSDSWGPAFNYQKASWDYFVNVNQEMWILEPR